MRSVSRNYARQLLAVARISVSQIGLTEKKAGTCRTDLISIDLFKSVHLVKKLETMLSWALSFILFILVLYLTFVSILFHFVLLLSLFIIRSRI